MKKSLVLRLVVAAFLSAVVLTRPLTAQTFESHVDSARTLHHAGQFNAALPQWRSAIELVPSEDDLNQCRVRLGQGATYLSLGRYSDAVHTLEEALRRADAAGDEALKVTASGSLGNAYILSSQVERGEALLREAIDAARLEGRYGTAASNANNLGMLLSSAGEPDRAIEIFEQALAESERAGRRSLSARIRVNLARALLDVRQPQRGREELSAAVSAIESLEASHDQAFMLVSAGRMYMGLSDSDRDAKVRTMAEMLGLDGILEQMPGALSGGQQQRVSLGRALIRG